ncbi:hypothetical protein H4582DRAFT_1780967, partial [Lactarius indigo]
LSVQRISGINRNPHTDMWVRKDLGFALLSTIRDRTKIRMEDWGTLAAVASRHNEGASWSARVQGWRLALWQPWRERQMKPSKLPSDRPLHGHLPLAIGTYNMNGFWSKLVEIGELLDEEHMAVLALQETLVCTRHYPIHVNGFRCYASHAKEDFRGIAMLVSNRLASYEVPHGSHWLIHVKAFSYARLSSPVHFINVYLKSGGNHRRTRKEQLQVVKGIVAKIIERDSSSIVVVMGDLNEP